MRQPVRCEKPFSTLFPQSSVIMGGVAPAHVPPLMPWMDDLYPASGRDHATWQSRAEQRSDDRGPRWRRLLGIVGALVVGLGVIVVGTIYWLHSRSFENTDDAFVDGYVTQMAPQVAGRVTGLKFVDNEHVTAGQVLLLIDPRDYQVKLDQVTAQRANAEAAVEQARAQLAVQRANLDQSRANVQVAESDLVQARQDYERFTSIDPHAVTRQQVDNATATFRSAQAKLDAAHQTVEGANAQVAAAAAQQRAAETQVRAADANVAAAELQLSYCTIVAPVTGRIGHRTVDVGNYVNPGQALFAIVQDDMWVTANFKETQLADIRPGQPVDISIDAILSTKFRGRVDSFQPGSGTEFSVLPAENATGNFVKIVQRLPVKIVFDDDRLKNYRVSPGLSVEPSVRVR
jgi:membrane fusion protein, multidrug efflux system